MNIADITLGKRPELRRVGVEFPDRTHLVMVAKRIYLELGVACDLEDNSIVVRTGHAAANWYAGLLERATGRMAFNEWIEQ